MLLTHEPEKERLPTDKELLTIIRERKLGFSALAILPCLRSWIHKNQRAHFIFWPTQREIADELGFCRAQVNRLIGRLRAQKVIDFRNGEYSFICCSRKKDSAKNASVLVFPERGVRESRWVMIPGAARAPRRDDPPFGKPLLSPPL